ncbi:unnamed protein product [Symbiodinium sp. KB8]|nr:unnamed protein product [Symbiodinium sp. KB8]
MADDPRRFERRKKAQTVATATATSATSEHTGVLSGQAERRRLRLELLGGRCPQKPKGSRPPCRTPLRQQKRRAEESRQRIQEVPKCHAGGAWHAVLGLTATATLQEVKQAFRDLALLHHPDKGFQSCDDTFRVVRLAYQQAITNFQEKAKAAGS